LSTVSANPNKTLGSSLLFLASHGLEALALDVLVVVAVPNIETTGLAGQFPETSRRFTPMITT
jgi:hypothetical protein